MKIHNYTLKKLKPKKINDLIRLGNKMEDGGYLLSSRQIGITKILIGLGVHYDWTFESEFKNKNKNLIVYCFDFSVGKLKYIKGFILSILNLISLNTYANVLLKKIPPAVFKQPYIEIKTYLNFISFFNSKKNNFFSQKGISDYRDAKFITISDVFDSIPNFNDLPENSIFIKMDIEGSEYDILEDILTQSSKINGMVIEFHNLKQLWNEFNYLIKEMEKEFEIIHIHGNNCGGCIGDTAIPNLIELSFIKRKLLDVNELNSINNVSYPLEGLDKPNIRKKPDLKISFQ